MQFAPIETLTLTADVTFAEQDIKEDRGEQTVWLQRNGFDHVVFDTGEEVATPVLLHEFTGSSKDFGYEQQHREQKNDLRSVGFNANWDVSEQFNLSFDYHNSRARSLPDDSITGGSETAFSLAGKVPSTCLQTVLNTNTADPTDTVCVNSTNFWTQTFQFNDGLPIAGRTLFPTPGRRVCRHERQPGLRLQRGQHRFAGSAYRLPGPGHRHQAGSLRW